MYALQAIGEIVVPAAVDAGPVGDDAQIGIAALGPLALVEALAAPLAQHDSVHRFGAQEVDLVGLGREVERAVALDAAADCEGDVVAEVVHARRRRHLDART